MHRHLPDIRSGSKEILARPAEFMADPTKGSIFHRQFKCRTYCLKQMKVLLDLHKFGLGRSVGPALNDTSDFNFVL